MTVKLAEHDIIDWTQEDAKDTIGWLVAWTIVQVTAAALIENLDEDELEDIRDELESHLARGDN